MMFIVRLEPLPPKVIFAFGTRAGLEELAVRIRLVAAVSTSPTVNGMGPIGAFTGVVWLAIGDMTGGSFTALTVTVKVRLIRLLLLWPSKETFLPMMSGSPP